MTIKSSLQNILNAIKCIDTNIFNCVNKCNEKNGTSERMSIWTKSRKAENLRYKENKRKVVLKFAKIIMNCNTRRV